MTNQEILNHNKSCTLTARLPRIALCEPSYTQMLDYNNTPRLETKQYSRAEIEKVKGDVLSPDEVRQFEQFYRDAPLPIGKLGVNHLIIRGNVKAKYLSDLKTLNLAEPYSNFMILLNNALVDAQHTKHLVIPEFLLVNVATDSDCHTVYRPALSRKEAIDIYNNGGRGICEKV